MTSFTIVMNPDDNAVIDQLMKDPHAFDGAIAAVRFLRGLPESQQHTARQQVDRLLSVWNRTSPDARKCFLLLEPHVGRSLTGARRGGTSSGRSRSEDAAEWKVVAKEIAAEEKRKLKSRGESVTAEKLVRRLRTNPKTKDLLAERSNATIEKAIKVRGLPE